MPKSTNNFFNNFFFKTLIGETPNSFLFLILKQLGGVSQQFSNIKHTRSPSKHVVQMRCRLSFHICSVLTMELKISNEYLRQMSTVTNTQYIRIIFSVSKLKTFEFVLIFVIIIIILWTYLYKK